MSNVPKRQSGNPPKGINWALMTIFKVMLVAFLTLGAVVVLTQLVGTVLGRGDIVSGVVDSLGLPMTLTASIAGLLGFIMAYTFHWKSEE
ncbi:hypothetical protein [Brevibacterium luteolum]|uniref:hypothetical protein n=1 Tax=Brevibacterium luteolum TaxID=199591 RepID=UPI00223C075A|nr:hypothetical protein [Brevibacterium luteolum]MCT1656855.1 hypothetical protein [Brevibacterium luteolum]